MKNKILLVEDDIELGQSLLRFFKDEGLDVTWIKDIGSYDELENTAQYKLLILDWMLPDGQGLDLLKKVRNSDSMVPIIMLTAKADLIDKVLGLESGANDYITKPFEPRELMARVRVQLRDRETATAQVSEKIVRGDLSIDLNQRKVFYLENEIILTKMEFDLLKLLSESPQRVFSREELLNKVWGYEQYPSTRTVDTHILQLRQKIDETMFETIRGIGYRFLEKS